MLIHIEFYILISSVRQQFQYREEEIERPSTHPTGPPQEEERCVCVCVRVCLHVH